MKILQSISLNGNQSGTFSANRSCCNCGDDILFIELIGLITIQTGICVDGAGVFILRSEKEKEKTNPLNSIGLVSLSGHSKARLRMDR